MISVGGASWTLVRIVHDQVCVRFLAVARLLVVVEAPLELLVLGGVSPVESSLSGRLLTGAEAGALQKEAFIQTTLLVFSLKKKELKMGGSTRSLFNPHLIAVGGQVGRRELVRAAKSNYRPNLDENDCIDSSSLRLSIFARGITPN